MLAVVSPAKKLDFSRPSIAVESSIPVFKKHADELAKVAKKLTRADLRQLMKISENLADLNYDRFQRYTPTPPQDATKQAALAFAGDTYTGLDAATLSENDLEFAQDNFRILSGLYGLLRPLDAIQAYRLEMGRRLKNPRGEDLYDFWGSDVAHALDQQLADHKTKTVINLASNEYFKVIDREALKANVLNMVFKEERDGELKIISFFAKKARGAMARHVIKNRIESPESLKEFTTGGYAYQPALSSYSDWVFTRK